MIIVRSPLRVSLGGGGTDLKSYYQDHEGFLIVATIDKYVYTTLHKTVVDYLILKYSEMEKIHSINDIKHSIIREAMKLLDIKDINLEITSMADIPAGTGLGSSSSFTCALLKTLHTYKKELIHPKELAEEACHVEIDILKNPIGKQDQFASAYGGINTFKFLKSGEVIAKPLKISDETLYSLEDNLLLFFTGYSRSASTILKEQDDKTKEQNISMTENLHYVKELGYKSQKAFESGNLEEFASIMNEHWQYKKQRSNSMSNPQINSWYNIALENGALGGKLIGAGGGGFLMFYTNENQKLRHAMAKEGLKEVRFKFDFEGTKVIT
jgi:D-glycero-alpha-D-manno-heptose-7-phosphate kinase